MVVTAQTPVPEPGRKLSTHKPRIGLTLGYLVGHLQMILLVSALRNI